MSATRLVGTLLVLAALLAPTALAATGTGPFTGTVRQGQTDRHTYDNNPDGNSCIQVMRTYTVTLTYRPTTDTLSLTVNGVTAVGSGGTATLTFQANHCTSFDILVSGTSVARSASYTVTVTRDDGATAL